MLFVISSILPYVFHLCCCNSTRPCSNFAWSSRRKSSTIAYMVQSLNAPKPNTTASSLFSNSWYIYPMAATFSFLLESPKSPSSLLFGYARKPPKQVLLQQPHAHTSSLLQHVLFQTLSLPYSTLPVAFYAV